MFVFKEEGVNKATKANSKDENHKKDSLKSHCYLLTFFCDDFIQENKYNESDDPLDQNSADTVRRKHFEPVLRIFRVTLP